MPCEFENLGKNISHFFLPRLTTLNQTDPHFIRCIVPNNHKTPGLLDSALVMHQVRSKKAKYEIHCGAF